MISSDPVRRAFQAGALIASLAFAVACSDSDPVDPDPHANIHQMIVQVEGGMQITFNINRIASGPLTIENNSVVTLTFLGPNGTEEQNAHDTERFDLRINYPNGNPAGLTFTPSAGDEFSGTFTRTTPSATPMIVQFELWHASETPAHFDGRWNAEVIVQ
jgi:hypothetical protein